MAYRRTPQELRQVATLFWTEELNNLADQISSIPVLLETQDRFISILGTGANNLDDLIQIVSLSGMPANLFVKHLMVLTDFGGEMLQRVNAEFGLIFPDKQFTYQVDGRLFVYEFRTLPITSKLDNKKLGADTNALSIPRGFDELLTDVVAILIFGRASTNEYTARVLEKCGVSRYLGYPTELHEYIKQRYIWVSRITAGEHSNALGQATQAYVRRYLESHLQLDNVRYSHGRLPGVSHTRDQQQDTSFDIVLQLGNKYVAIEVSFQVTTNSVIERKGGQARNRYEQINTLGYKIAYVIDGAGNFQRETAINHLCEFSHCTVAFSDSELDVLCEFIRDYFLAQEQ
jgi:hypothetical protein